MHTCTEQQRQAALDAARAAAERHHRAHVEVAQAVQARNAAVAAAHRAGVRLTTIAQEVGVSVQRIHQIVHTTTGASTS